MVGYLIPSLLAAAAGSMPPDRTPLGMDARAPTEYSMCIGVLVADDNQMVRAGLRGVFEHNGFEVLAEATTPVQTLSYARNPRVQVVLLDISWISADETSVREAGFDLLCKIRSARPGLPVLMYSIEADAECIERCRRLGADGYLIKGLDDGLLSFAVRAVHAGVQIWPTSCAGPHRHKLAQGRSFGSCSSSR